VRRGEVSEAYLNRLERRIRRHAKGEEKVSSPSFFPARDERFNGLRRMHRARARTPKGRVCSGESKSAFHFVKGRRCVEDGRKKSRGGPCGGSRRAARLGVLLRILRRSRVYKLPARLTLTPPCTNLRTLLFSIRMRREMSAPGRGGAGASTPKLCCMCGEGEGREKKRTEEGGGWKRVKLVNR